MPRTRIALVTCTELPRPDLELPVLAAAIERAGGEAAIASWDDPSVGWEGFDVAVIRSTWNYVRRFDAYTAWLERAAAATRLVNPLPVLRWNLHKRYLLELAAAGVPVVPTVLLEPGERVSWSELFGRWGELVLKPAISAGSFATIRVPPGDAARAEAHRAGHPTRTMMVQPFLGSVLERGERNLVHFGGRFSHALAKGARWSGEPEASGGALQPDPDELALARQALAAVDAKQLGAVAYARVDIARDGQGRAVLMELEMLEPSLFLERVPEAAGRFAAAVLAVERSSRDDG